MGWVVDVWFVVVMSNVGGFGFLVGVMFELE